MQKFAVGQVVTLAYPAKDKIKTYFPGYMDAVYGTSCGILYIGEKLRVRLPSTTIVFPNSLTVASSRGYLLTMSMECFLEYEEKPRRKLPEWF
jgi:hypothetical protein